MLILTKPDADFSRGARTQQCERPFPQPAPTCNAREPEPWKWDSGPKWITSRPTVNGPLV